MTILDCSIKYNYEIIVPLIPFGRENCRYIFLHFRLILFAVNRAPIGQKYQWLLQIR